MEACFSICKCQPHARAWLRLRRVSLFPSGNTTETWLYRCDMCFWLHRHFRSRSIFSNSPYYSSSLFAAANRCKISLLSWAIKFDSYIVEVVSSVVFITVPSVEVGKKERAEHTKLCSLPSLFSLVTARADSPRSMLCTKASLRALCASILSGVFCAAAKLSHSTLMRSTVSAAICVVSTS